MAIIVPHKEKETFSISLCVGFCVEAKVIVLYAQDDQRIIGWSNISAQANNVTDFTH